MFRVNGVMKRRLFLLEAILLSLSCLFSFGGMITASALGSYESIAYEDEAKTILADIDWTSYTFDELCAFGFSFPDNVEGLKQGGLGDNGNGDVGKALYFDLKSSYEYDKWLRQAKKIIAQSGGSSSGGGNAVKVAENTFNGVITLSNDNPYDFITMEDLQGGGKSSGYTGTKTTFIAMPALVADNPDLNETALENAWAEYNQLANEMTRILARGQANTMTREVFTNEWNPTSAVTVAAMKTLSRFCNTAFKSISMALMLFVLLQSGLDGLYLAVDFTEGFLAPAASGGNGGNGDGILGGLTVPWKFNLVSREAISAKESGSAGSVSDGGGFFKNNIAVAYLSARFPLLLIVFVYIVLVATNVWTDIISGATSLIVGFFYGL